MADPSRTPAAARPAPACPVCGKPAAPAQSRLLPFCSVRCANVDLGRWVTGQYVVPGPACDDGSEALDLGEGMG